MNNYKFYMITKKELLKIAKTRGLDEKGLEKYYELTDKKNKVFKGLKEIPLVFAQLAMHAANATMISGIIDFENNIKIINDITKNFNPKAFIKLYNIDINAGIKKQDEKVIKKIVSDMSAKGIVWDSSQSSEGRKDSIVKRYANSLIESAIYLNDFSNRKEVLNDFKSYYINHDVKTIIKYFNTKIKSGFSIALVCDFLKEFDKTFNDIAKPDVHILDIINCKDNETSTSDRRKYECIEELRNIVADVNKKDPKEKLTVYKLDRMIWLICSNKFFLDDAVATKKKYKEKIY